MSTDTHTAKEHDSLIQRLFKAGAHFGFSRSRRHPTVAPYIYGTKQGTDIFDLEKTAELLDTATTRVRALGTEGKKVLLVGTKEEIAGIVERYAVRLEVSYITHRWIGGTFTNFSEIKKRVARLTELQSQTASGELERKYTKKERLMLTREIDKLDYNFGGIQAMEKMPDALVVVDPRHESIAVSEARQMNIPVIAVMSSDCDVHTVDVPVIVNDSHKESVTLALEEIASAYEEGKKVGAQKKESTKEAVRA